MFDFVHKNKRIIQVVLALIFLPFAFFGVDSYFRNSESAEAVATVGDYQISQQEFTQALRDRQDSLRNLSGGRIDPAQLDSAELRYAVLDSLIRQKLLLSNATRSGMTLSERQLQGTIMEIPAFQENGKFSYPQYERFLRSQNMTPVMFEARLRQQILLQQIDDAYADSNFVSRTVSERLSRIAEQQREVSQAVIPAERFLPQVKLEDGAAKKYYDGHPDEFRIPEQVRVEYVVLSSEEIASQVKVQPADLKKYYDEHMSQFEVKEQRQARHILITVDPSASADAKQKARAKADEIYQQVKQKPDSFAELAKKYSQDPGSAQKGGDLGTFSRGSMVKAFDDAVFSMKPGDISAPVETQYGYHIINLTGVRPGHTESLEQARPQIEAEVKKQLAGRKFAELAESFNNTVFEQSDSLKPAAQLVNAAPRQSGWIMRNHADDPRLNEPRVLQAIFSDDVLNNKRNTEAIEAKPGTLIAARVIEHKPATLKPFEEVSAAIAKKLTLQRASQLAAQEGRQELEKLRKGEAAQLSWSAPQLVHRTDAKALPQPVLQQAFKADVAKLPAYSGVEAPPGSYTLIKVSRVVDPGKVEPEKQKNLAESLQQAVSQEEMSAYLASLKQKADVKIKQDLLEKK